MQLNIDLAKSDRKPIHVLQVDINKAYDSVGRTSLINRLKAKGIPANITNVLIAGFEAETAMRDGNTLSEAFHTTIGIKQGCPASPVLFNILLADMKDRIQHEWAYKHPSQNTALPHSPLILYADDATLIAHTPTQLQSMYHTAAAYLKTFGLKIN